MPKMYIPGFGEFDDTHFVGTVLTPREAIQRRRADFAYNVETLTMVLVRRFNANPGVPFVCVLDDACIYSAVHCKGPVEELLTPAIVASAAVDFAYRVTAAGWGVVDIKVSDRGWFSNAVVRLEAAK